MFATAEKTNHHPAAVQQKTGAPAFFRKAGEGSFFGNKGNGTPAVFFAQPIQPKLSVSSPDDPQEKEADQVADKVMRMPEPVASILPKQEEQLQRKEEEEEKLQAKQQAPVIKIQAKGDPFKNIAAGHPKEFGVIQRRESVDAVDEEKETSVQRKAISLYPSDIVQQSGRGPPPVSIQPSFEQGLSSSKGSGEPLQPTTQQFMESRFSADFSGVRIHTGSHAQQLSSNINAQAFTHGNDIYFNAGKYSPQTESGGTLLAHELTHTVQQGASPAGESLVSRKRTTLQNRIAKKEQPASYQSPVIHRSLIDEGLLSQIDLSARPGGHQLPPDAREYLQGYFHTNIDDIRIHSDREIATLCKAAGINAFVKGKDIAIVPSRLNMETEEGAVLLSEQVSKSLKQRGVRSTGTDGNEVGGPSSLISQITAAIKANEAAANKTVSKEKTPPVPADIASAKAKEQAGNKPLKTGQEKKAGKKTGKKGKGKARDSEGPVFKPVKSKPGKSPSVPAEDPAFQKVVKKTKSTAKNQKQHEPAETKSSDAQKSAEAVPKEAESKAQDRKTDGMGAATKEDKPFDAATFKADLLKKIEEVTPKTLEEATEFKENNKIGDVKNAMGEKVASEKTNSTGPVDKATAQPLQVNDADNKKPLPLPPTSKGPRPAGVGAKDAAPKNKMEGEISMQEQSQSLDEEMKANNITEDQLIGSNEPSFSQAVDEKRNAQKDAEEKPQQYRKEETLVIKEAKTTAGVEAAQALSAMHGARGKNFDATVKHQQTAKQKDEETRATIAKAIEDLYTKAEEKVNTALTAADTESNKIFDEGSEAARIAFENYVDDKMRAYKRRRYSGFWGGLKWAKDKIFGMPDEVNKFYVDGRKLYLDKMDLVITQVADTVTLKLNEAKQAITDGKKEIDQFVSDLPKNQQDIGKEAASNIQDKFDSLEQSVNDKRNDLIDGLAKKYVDNVKQLDERINELKEANKGLIDKAIGFLKKVWKVIKDLTNLFTTILARLASIIGIIIGSPGGFFDNLGKAFNKGFNNFKDKFLDYLENGLMIWLATNLGIAGIELPEKFSPASILSLVLQVMGITKQHIRERAVVLLGERKVKLLESAGGLLFKVYNEGLGALWDLIVEKITDFKEIIWEAIKSFIKTKIIEAAITFLLSLLNPIGAFIKVCMAIYDFLMMLVRFKDRIIELLDTILNAVVDVANGAIEGAAVAIEKAFAKSIPIIIAFLAALLHLNDIAVRVRSIITRIRTRVDKAIDYAITKAYSLIGKGVEGLLSIEEKGRKAVEKGKDIAVGAGKKIAGSLLKWLGLKKEFEGADGKPHQLYFAGTEQAPVLMVQSNPTAYTSFITSIEVGANKNKGKAKKEALSIAEEVDEKRRAPLAGTTEEEKEKSKEAKIKAVDKLLGKLSVPTAVLFGDPAEAGEPEVDHRTQGAGHAILMTAKRLNKKQALKGSPPTSSDTASYAVLNTRRQSASASYYVKGHMLNDNIGGRGVWENLTPLSREGNSNHEGTVESLVKAAFNSGAVVEYNVKAKYGYGKNAAKIPAGDPQREQKLKIINEEKQVPTHLECDAWIMEKKAGAFVRKQNIVTATVANPVEQDAIAYILEGSPGRPDIFLNASDVSVIATIENVSASLAVKIELAHTESGNTRFNSYTDLSNAKKTNGKDIFTAIEKEKIRSLSTLKYVKLYKGTV